ncbi:hypothetical protein JCM10207_005162 [Rhodosporidiobolus poonsookiae]
MTTPCTPLTKKRPASLGSAFDSAAALAFESARKRARGPTQGQEADVVLVSSDGHRFPFSSRMLSASAPIWDTLLPPALSHAAPSRLGSPAPSISSTSTSTTPADLPEVHLPDSAQCLAYLLPFLHPAPVRPRPVEFPRDWETVRAADRYSIWRALDALSLSLSPPLPTPTLLAPAFAFALVFRFPDLARSTALEIAKYATTMDRVREVTDGLARAREEWGVEGRGVEQLLTWLLLRLTHLTTLRSSALHALRAFDDPYDCEHSCTGLVYAHLCDVLSTTSRKRLRKVDEKVRFDCKDCDTRWDAVAGKVGDGLGEMPECPFGQEEEEEEGMDEDAAELAREEEA